MPAFCPPNISISDVWVNHGVSHCFMDTVSSSVISSFILLFGTVQLIIYKKYSTRIDRRRVRPSFLYKFQIFLILLLTVLTALRFELRWKYYDGAEIYGFMVSDELFWRFKLWRLTLKFSDPLHLSYDPVVFVLDLLDCKRATLPAAISPNSRPWHRESLITKFHKLLILNEYVIFW